jgi:hypothetical protein
MSSTILQAPSYDPRRERRRKILIAGVVAIVVLAGALAFFYRYASYERLVGRFFMALQQKDYEAAYGIWMADPDWKQHPERHARYPFSNFYRDWGPGGEWGLVRTFEVEGAASSGGSGIVVRVRVNDRAVRANIWVEKRDKTLTVSPFETIQ